MNISNSPRLTTLLNSTSSLSSISSLDSSTSSSPSPTSNTPSASTNLLLDSHLILPTLSFQGMLGTESDTEEMSLSNQQIGGTEHKTEELEQTTNKGFSYLSSIRENISRITAQLPRLEPRDWGLSLSVCVIAVLYQIYTARTLERKYEIEFEQMLNHLLKQAEQAMNSPMEKDDLIFAKMDSMKNQFDRIAEHLNQPGQQGLYLAFCALMLSLSGMAVLWRKMNGMQAAQFQKSKEDLNNRTHLESSFNESINQLQSALSKQIDGVNSKIKEVQNDLAKADDRISRIENKPPQPNSDLETAQAAQLNQQATEIAATAAKIDNLRELCQMIGNVVQDLIKHLQERSQVNSISQEITNKQLVGPQWPDQPLGWPRSDWGPWNGSQQSSDSPRSPSELIPPLLERTQELETQVSRLTRVEGNQVSESENPARPTNISLSRAYNETQNIASFQATQSGTPSLETEDEQNNLTNIAEGTQNLDGVESRIESDGQSLPTSPEIDDPSSPIIITLSLLKAAYSQGRSPSEESSWTSSPGSRSGSPPLTNPNECPQQ
ncbi:hypothetical protein [Mycoavidus sp. B2-EB]|uniref:hypothetical protein n=1 Tax=Mycoavidus sp. B2-EB TaxID=2651972 RepID=UPI001626EFFB|nr:hypothetical protein [Mycoavidus sp. B2-EB]BBO59090.1 hypothetical protein MPB2EB_0191 [Mycoavidus sp. B2-EB]